MAALAKPLWRCPKCGAKLVTRNQGHSCGKFSLTDLFARSDPSVLPLVPKYAALVRQCGTVTMIPQKIRVVFMHRVRFTAAYQRQDHFVAGIMVGRRLRHRRIGKIEKLGSTLFGHHVKISSAADLDATQLGWLRESYHCYGRQERLRGRRA